MRILIASPNLPWPLNAGGNAAQFSTLKCLAEDHQFTLVCPVYTATGVANAEALQVELPQIRVRPVFCGQPPTQSLTRAARSLGRLGRKVLKSAETRQEEVKIPYYPFRPLPEKLIGALHEELSKEVDLFQAEFAEMLPLGAWVPRHIPKLFIHHQIHFVYAKRFLDTHGRTGFSNYLESLMLIQEQAYLQKFDGVIAFSETDREALAPLVRSEKLFTSPFPIPADVGIAETLPLAFDQRFLFVASEIHDPNRDALEWLIAKIWPAIKSQLNTAQLVVVGNWSEAAQMKLKSPGVKFVGFVPDLASTLRGGIMLVPLRIGSGLRVKIMVAMAQGVPVVSTSVGYEGLLIKNEKELLVRDGAIEFADAAVHLARTPALWHNLAEAGKNAISHHYSPEGVRHRRNEIYSALCPRV